MLKCICLNSTCLSIASFLLSVAASTTIAAASTDDEHRLAEQNSAEESFVWPQAPSAPSDAPNILLILTDDVGFSASSAFGGPIATPVFTQLAEQGLRYTQYQNSAICSATRAALLTGRNPHNVGMGRVPNAPTPYDGYTGFIPPSAGSVAQVLKSAGYRTAAFGKWHLVPDWEESPAGPFDRWPTGMGFEEYYGFLAADTDQFAPTLYHGNSHITPPDNPDYILDRDLADRASAWIIEQKELAADVPFFMYYAPGSTHAPHQAPLDWIARFRGKFDEGWDVLREQSFERQKQAGIIPENAELTPRPESIPAWDALSQDAKRLASRMMEVYAAQLAFSDAQIGRLIDALEQTGQRKNTLVIFIQGDNGASAEGGAHGSLYEQAFMNRFQESVPEMIEHIDDLGGPKAYNNYPAGFAWALNAPFQYYKQTASHLGGVRNGLVISWPNQIRDIGSIRSQFHFVSDIMPTILDAAQVRLPKKINDVEQMPLDGISMRYSFDMPTAQSRRKTQVFETMQNLAIYHEGWWAGTLPIEVPWDFFKPEQTSGSQDRTWQLFNLADDYSQAHDLARTNPGKLREMRDLFFIEAAKNQILPIHPASAGGKSRPTLLDDSRPITFENRITRLPTPVAPNITGVSFTITAEVYLKHDNAGGVIVTHGGKFGGYALYLQDGVPVFHYNAIGANHQYNVRGNKPLGAGRHTIIVDMKLDHPIPGNAAVARLIADGKEAATGRIERTLRTRNSIRETFDIGEDTLTPINEDYTTENSLLDGDVLSVQIDRSLAPS